MKSKIYTIIACFVIFIALLMTSSYAVVITEDADTYKEGALIYGSTRFETDVVITASKAYDAGVNEAKLNVALGKDLSEIKPVVPYFFDGASWYQITESEEEPAKPLTEKQVKDVEENLNIFFVNNEVKTVEVEYEGNVDKTSLPSNVEYKDGKFIVPATTFNFTFTETKVVDGEEVVIANEVSTNIDKNVTNGTEEKPVIEEPSKKYVAKVGNEYFEDLALAIAKVTAENEVVLIENVELKEGLEITNTVTLNLNGKTLSASKYMESLALIKVKDGNLTINGEGTVNSASQGNDYSMAVWTTGTGVATINGGTFTNVGAKSVEDNGTTPNNNELIYVNGSGKVYINGGTFTGNTENKKWGTRYTLNLKDSENKVAAIVVKGGTFTAYDPANSKSENPTANLVAEGYKVVEKQIENSSEFEYTVAKIDEKDVVISNAVAYQDLQTAVDNATEIKLLQNIELTEGIVVTKNVTIDLNGKTLSANKDMESLALIKVDGGNLTINGEGKVNSASQGNDYSMAVWATGTGVVTINGGTFTNVGAKSVEDNGTTPNNNELIYANGSGKIYINGGSFTGNTENQKWNTRYTLNLKDNSEATIEVKGGTFTGYDPANSKSENPTANLVAEGYKSVKEGDTYKVLPYDANNVTDEAELRALIAEGKSVKLAADVELSKQIVVTKAVTLDFNGKTIKVAEDLEDISAILVLTGGDLVITGNGKLDAASQGNNYSIAVWAKETGNVTIKNGTFTNVGAKSKTETGSNNNEMIYVSGSGVITIEGGTFTGNTENEKWGTHYTLNAHDASYKAGTAKIIVKGGTYTKFNPEKSDSENPRANFLAEGYKVVADGDNYTVVAE